jgi:hypothetical protein
VPSCVSASSCRTAHSEPKSVQRTSHSALPYRAVVPLTPRRAPPCRAMPCRTLSCCAPVRPAAPSAAPVTPRHAAHGTALRRTDRLCPALQQRPALPSCPAAPRPDLPRPGLTCRAPPRPAAPCRAPPCRPRPAAPRLAAAAPSRAGPPCAVPCRAVPCRAVLSRALPCSAVQ